MQMIPRTVLAGLSFLWLVLAAPAAHADVVIDAFTDGLGPVLWAGTDSNNVYINKVSVSQSNLDGVNGNNRTTSISNVGTTAYVTATVDSGQLVYRNSQSGGSGQLTLQYNNLSNLNLSDEGFLRIAVSNLGAYKVLSLPVTISLTCGTSITAVSKSFTLYARYGRSVTSYIPLSDFKTGGCSTLTDVNRIVYAVDASNLFAEFSLTGGLKTLTSIP